MAGIPSAIVGFGMAAKVFHAPLINAAEDLQLVAVSTSRPDAAPPGVRVSSAEQILTDRAVELVVIATPNHTHFDLADAALRAGKHVVVDKPFTVTAAEAESLIARAGEVQRLLTVFHNRRWDSDYLTVKKLVAGAELGRITLFEAHWDRFRPKVPTRWRETDIPGSGLLYDLGPHMIDQVLQLFGNPEHVSGDLEAQREGAQVDDYFRLTLHYGRMRAILSASSMIAQPRPRFALHGTGGSFVKFGLDPQEARLKEGADPADPSIGVEDAGCAGTLTRGDGSSARVESECGDYLAFYRAVAAAVRGGPPPVAPEDALTGLRILELAGRGAAEGRRLPYSFGHV